MQPRRLLTINEVCSCFSISRSTFYALRNQGLIKTVKIGSRTLIVPEEVERFIDALEEE